MHLIGRGAIVALAVLMLTPARAEGPVKPTHPQDQAAYACLDQKERRAAVEGGKLIPLAAAMRSAKKRMPGTVVRARLCRGDEGLVYVLTVLARDGKVARLTVDARKGAPVGQR